MFDRTLVIEKLIEVESACDRVILRASTIDLSDSDGELSEEELMCLDSIAMLLIAIGENLKHVERHATAQLFAGHPQVNWAGAKGIRDVISHGYFLINYDIVWSAAEQHVPGLRDAIIEIREGLENGGTP